MEKQKHNHKGTKKIKIILFAIVLLLPILAVFTITLYYTFNETTPELTTNLFDYAINQIQNSNIITWVNNTTAYTAINAMFTGLNANNSFIISLLTYWIMIALIYVVFDIVIETFTFLTHLLVGEK